MDNLILILYFFGEDLVVGADMDAIASSQFRFHGRQSYEALDGVLLRHHSPQGLLRAGDGAES